MEEQLKDIIAGLSDLGCGREELSTAERLIGAGRPEELVKHLRRCRCELMDQLHESQRRIDRMDYIIRQTEKSITRRK